MPQKSYLVCVRDRRGRAVRSELQSNIQLGCWLLPSAVSVVPACRHTIPSITAINHVMPPLACAALPATTARLPKWGQLLTEKNGS